MSTIAPPGEALALIFKLNSGLVTRSLDGLSDDDVWRRPPEGGNPMAWILGHITEARVQLLALLGQPMPLDWAATFQRGAQLRGRADYPDRARLEGAWRSTHGRMRDAFTGLTAARLAEPYTGKLPGATDLAGAIAFHAFHEAYHVGQLGYLRRQLGFSAVAD